MARFAETSARSRFSPLPVCLSPSLSFLFLDPPPPPLSCTLQNEFCLEIKSRERKRPPTEEEEEEEEEEEDIVSPPFACEPVCAECLADRLPSSLLFLAFHSPRDEIATVIH